MRRDRLLTRSVSTPGTEAGMLPLVTWRIEDLGQSEVVKVDCAAGHYAALLTPHFGRSPGAKVLDLMARVRCRGCGARGRTIVSVKWGPEGGSAAFGTAVSTRSDRSSRGRPGCPTILAYGIANR